MSVSSIVYTMLDDKSPVRGRPESSKAGFRRPDSFMPFHLDLGKLTNKNFPHMV